MTILALVLGLLSINWVNAEALFSLPDNDDFDNATVITESPFDEVISSNSATTADDDPQMECESSANSHTVWYKLKAGGGPVVFNTFSSRYDTVLAVFTGTRGDLTLVECDDDTGSLQSEVEFNAIPGETYYFEIASYDDRPGGLLKVHAEGDIYGQGCPLREALTQIDEVNLFVRVRDQLLTTSPAGEQIIALYYDHAPEMAKMVFLNGELRQSTIELLHEWMPSFQALLGEGGYDMRLTTERQDKIQALLHEYSGSASPALRTTLAKLSREVATHQGKSMQQIWVQFRSSGPTLQW
ncbi:MAG: hypothetical protein ACPGWR_20860 [Ardenticatenaceae bacterium]